MFTSQIHGNGGGGDTNVKSRAKHIQVDDEEQSTNASSFEVDDSEVNKSDRPVDAKYHFHLAKTEKWSTYVNYTGYFIILGNLFAMILTILNILGFIEHESAAKSRNRQQKRDKLIEQMSSLSENQKQAQEAQIDIEERRIRLHDMVYSPAQENMDLCFKLVDEAFCILQGWLMIKATEMLLKQVSNIRRQRPPRLFVRFADSVKKYQSYIIGIIIFLILLKAARSFLMYVLVENFLKKEFKDSYDEYKLLLKESKTNPMITSATRENEHVINKEYKQMEQIWSEFGIFSSLIMISGTVSCCSMIICCLHRLTKNLEQFENDPHNPANGSNI